LQDNPRGVILVRDELVGWVRSLNQYKGGRGADREFYLAVWSGEPYLINRKGQADPIHVTDPFLCVVGGLPPDLLHELADAHSREDGFVQRILFSYPEAASESWSALSVSPRATRAWELTVQKLWLLAPVRQQGRPVTPLVLTLTAEARAAWARFCRAHDAERADPDLPPYLRGAWNKLVGYGARLALVLHELRFVCGEAETEQIDETSILGAWALVDYFKSHARRVYRELQHHPKAKQAQRRVDRLVEWIKDHGARCNIRHLQNKNVVGITRASEAQRLLEDLVDRGLGRFEPGKTPTGHPSKRAWFVLTV
jgi:hypothetical protein